MNHAVSESNLSHFKEAADKHSKSKALANAWKNKSADQKDKEDKTPVLAQSSPAVLRELQKSVSFPAKPPNFPASAPTTPTTPHCWPNGLRDSKMPASPTNVYNAVNSLSQSMDKLKMLNNSNIKNQGEL